MAQRVQKLVAVGGVGGDVGPFEQLFAELSGNGTEAIVLVGELSGPESKGDAYRAVFRALGEAGFPAFWVPGPTDAPLHDYLRESYNIEIAFPSVRGVHGTVALGDAHVLFAGVGGDVLDDPSTIRDEDSVLRYAGWEAEYRLKVIREFDAPEKVLLFTTPPAHKGLHAPGSEVVAELIKTYNPRFAIVAGEEPAQEELANTVVVCPGRLDRGSYALIDLRARSVEAATLGVQAAV
jgi:Icc-related predicted phosphoesterase